MRGALLNTFLPTRRSAVGAPNRTLWNLLWMYERVPLSYFDDMDRSHPLNETASTAFDKSCYKGIDWKIDSADTVENAIKRMIKSEIGAIAVTRKWHKENFINGIITERDIIRKVATLDRDPADTLVRDVCTYGISNLRHIHPDAPVHWAMERMIEGNIRHLFILSSKIDQAIWPHFFSGLISIRDVIKFTKVQDEAVVSRLEDKISLNNVKETLRDY